MKTELILLTIQAVITASYLMYIVKGFGVRPSISESYYILHEKRRWMFWAFCWGVSLPFFFIYPNIWFFLAASFFMLVGAATAYRLNKLTRIPHVIGASATIIFAFIGIWVVYGTPIPAICMIIISGVFWDRAIKNLTWWVEVLALLLIIGSVFIMEMFVVIN